jgi:lipopolysaccharide biosynthesis glycosyltransferase
MKNLIIQYYHSADLPKWAEFGSRRFNQYATHVGCEYQIKTEPAFSPEVSYFEHLDLIYNNIYDEYDNILYADTDVIVNSLTQNIFETKFADVAMMPEHRDSRMNCNPWGISSKTERDYKKAAKMFGLSIAKSKVYNTNFLMFNSGVILWSNMGRRKAKDLFMNWKDWYKKVKGHQMNLDQPYINSQVTNLLDYTELDLKWNCFPPVRFENNQLPSDAVFVHYTGQKKKFILEDYNA